MAHVNLLPWREIARQRAKQKFGIQAFIALLIAAGLVFAAYTIIQDYQQSQRARNQFLSAQIAILDEQIAEIQEINKKKDQIVNRMQLIQSLHRDRNTAIQMLNELSERTPDGVHIVSVEKQGDRLSLQGRSVSNNRVSEFLRAISDSEIFNNPVLRQISAEAEGVEGPTRYSAFSLSVTIARPTNNASAAQEGKS